MSAEGPGRLPSDAPFARLERALIDEYVRSRGHDPLKLDELPESEREPLLHDAFIYASGKLVEAEARSRLLDEMHDGVPGIHKSGLE